MDFAGGPGLYSRQLPAYDLCISCMWPQPLLHGFLPYQEPPHTFLQQVSYDDMSSAELAWQGLQHDDEEQGTEFGTLVDTDLHLKLLAVTLTHTDKALHMGIHSLDYYNRTIHSFSGPTR